MSTSSVTMTFHQTTWIMMLLAISSHYPINVLGDYQTIGINYGNQGDFLPTAADVVKMFLQHKVDKMRIFSPDHWTLEALNASRQTGDSCAINLYMGTTNEDLVPLAGNIDYARRWVQIHIVPYGQVCFDCITAGNEAIPGPDSAFIAPAIRNLRVALDAEGFPGIRVSTVVPATVLGVSFPPSKAAFSDETVKDMTAILKEIAIYSDDPYIQQLMINVYPYFGYAADPVNVPLAYAQFSAYPPVMDGQLAYYSLFDATVDCFYSAMEKVGFSTVGLTVTETGWPSDGNGNFTTKELAWKYNMNVKNKISVGIGTPKRPDYQMQAFIFAMFNEDLKPRGVERNFGLFYPDKTPVYDFFIQSR